MKATHNGVPSLSIPDGWWVEGLIEGVTGWGIGQEILTETDPNKIDEMDANDLYEKLEKQIIPMYYNDPMAYVVIMRNAIAINAAYFNTHRMVNQYLVGAYARNHMV
jgi:starch phosphorylase